MNLLLVAINKYLLLSIVQCLHGRDVKIYVLGTKKVSSIRFSRHCKGYLICSIENISNPDGQFLKEIDAFCREKRIDVVIPCEMESTFFLSKIKNKIKNAKTFPVPDLKTLQKLNNKWEFTNFLKKNSLPHPKSILLKNFKDLNEIEIDFPIIIKPLEMYGGIGVKKLDSIEEANKYLSQKHNFNSFPLIAQKFINGYGIDVSFLTKNGKIVAWTIQKSEPDGSITFVNNPYVLKMVDKIASKIKYTGIAHIDMIFDTESKSLKMLEFNPRFWGSILGSKEAGINFPYIGSLVSLNRPIRKYIKYTKSSFIPTGKAISSLLKVNLKHKDKKKIVNSEIREMLADPLPYVYSFIANRISLPF